MAVAELTPTLDRKLKKVIDYETFGRNIASAAILEARKQASQRNGDTTPQSPISVQMAAKIHVNADPVSKGVLVTVETPSGHYSVSV